MNDIASSHIANIGQYKLEALHQEAARQILLEPHRQSRRKQLRRAWKALRYAVQQILALEPSWKRGLA